MTPNLTAPIASPAALGAKLLTLLWEDAPKNVIDALTAELDVALVLTS